MTAIAGLPSLGRAAALSSRKSMVPAATPKVNVALQGRTSRKTVLVRATQSTPPPPQQDKNAVAKFSDSIGLPTDEGFFGFKPFSEVWTGRWAMLGFVASIIGEGVTGRGTLGQLGIDTPSQPILIALCTVFGGLTVAASGVTLKKIWSKEMSKKDVSRYKNFLGLNNPDDYKVEEAKMKKKGDFTTPGLDYNAINASRAEGSLADEVLSPSSSAQEQEAAREMKSRSTSVAQLEPPSTSNVVKVADPLPSVSQPGEVDLEDKLFNNYELRYARRVELDNGRAAMIGFLAAILVEAATGKGIILQVIMYLKLSGLLGPMSGF